MLLILEFVKIGNKNVGKRVTYAIHLPCYKYLEFNTDVRRNKKQIEDELAEILREIIQLKNSEHLLSEGETSEKLKTSKNKLIQLKTKLKNNQEEQQEIFDICKKKVHLDKQNTNTKHHLIHNFNKEVIQFFACRNKITQARSILKSLKNENDLTILIDLYEKAHNISQSIIKNDLRPLKNWCYDHSHYLSKMKSNLELKLISCSFINILNNAGGVLAIEFIRKEVAQLTLSTSEKVEIDQLIFKVLLAEDEKTYDYYSDSEEEKNIKDKNGENKIQCNQLISSSSSEKLIDEELLGSENKLKKLMEAVGEMAQGVQNVLGGSEESLEEIEGRFNFDNSPVDLVEEEIYEEKFDSMDEDQDEEQIAEVQYNGIDQQFNYDEEKIHEKLLRKHKLDKNGLRILLLEAKNEFMLAFSKIYKLSFETTFDKTLAIGISLLKTTSCSELNPQQKDLKKQKCPTCNPEILKLSIKIPTTQRTESAMICRINGSLMNEINYPIALPNGQIYSIEGLQKTQKQGRYFCLTEQKYFKKEDCKKVFLT